MVFRNYYSKFVSCFSFTFDCLYTSNFPNGGATCFCFDQDLSSFTFALNIFERRKKNIQYNPLKLCFIFVMDANSAVVGFPNNDTFESSDKFSSLASLYRCFRLNILITVCEQKTNPKEKKKTKNDASAQIISKNKANTAFSISYRISKVPKTIYFFTSFPTV